MVRLGTPIGKEEPQHWYQKSWHQHTSKLGSEPQQCHGSRPCQFQHRSSMGLVVLGNHPLAIRMGRHQYRRECILVLIRTMACGTCGLPWAWRNHVGSWTCLVHHRSSSTRRERGCCHLDGMDLGRWQQVVDKHRNSRRELGQWMNRRNSTLGGPLVFLASWTGSNKAGLGELATTSIRGDGISKVVRAVECRKFRSCSDPDQD